MTKNWTKKGKKKYLKKTWINWGEKIGKNKWLELKKKIWKEKKWKKVFEKDIGTSKIFETVC